MTRKVPLRQPQRSNQSLSLDRSLEAVKTIYWTSSTLRKLLRRVIKNDRQQWFAARVRALKSWPVRTREQIMEDAARTPGAGTPYEHRWWLPLSKRGCWPKSELEIQRELLKSAPENRIDVEELRKVLAELDYRQGERLIEMLAESGLLKDTTVPLDNGLPEPKELPVGLLRRIKRQHGKLMRLIKDGYYDNDLREIDYSEVLHVPIANQKSSAGTAADMAPSDEEWAEIVEALRAIRGH